ncbi:hypothetical protein [Sorangium sp. So ce887]|uniref:hypothetical protein n=1 Tax=Sorangium sp. So ce887 TaxID=3133324 RepID=UPI003F647192
MAMRCVRSWVAGGLLLGAGGLAAAGGCGAGEYDCAEGVTCEIVNANGTSNGHCWGQCVPEPPRGFDEPMLVWTGLEMLAPSCDDLVWAIPGTNEVIRIADRPPAFVGRTPPGEAPSCPVCACTAPSCALPSDVTTSSLRLCEGENAGTRTPFAPPPGWDGSCVSPGWVPSELLGSLYLGSTTEQPCAPVVEESPAPPDALTGEVAIACSGKVSSTLCAQDGQRCMLYQQQDHLPEGWRHCILADGDDRECQAPVAAGDPWPRFSEKLGVFYTEVDDTRGCTPCTCKPPETHRCEADLSAYEDRACSDFLVVGRMTTQRAICVDPGSTRTLGSLSATWIVNEPGRCTPEGGAPVGEIDARGPKTICCLPRDT